jgi:hypothetical protein
MMMATAVAVSGSPTAIRAKALMAEDPGDIRVDEREFESSKKSSRKSRETCDATPFR